MNLSLDEQDFIETIREWSADPDQLDFVVSCKNGVWECEMRSLWRNGVAVFRGVGTSFVEAFNNLDGNDVEPAPDDPG